MKMDGKNGWKIKIDEKKDKQVLFTTKSYVSIQTLPLHNWEICVNWNTTYSSPRGMFPLGIETIWDHTFLIPFQPIFYLNLVFQTSYF
jgi:hypothetical protein